MSPKITAEHVQRGALVYVRQSTVMQVVEHTESKRRQYAVADLAREMGFATVEVIDEDLGRSGSGLVARPGFQRLVAAVCTGAIGAVVCLEASRLARNGRDWHHLIDLCALVGALVIDHGCSGFLVGGSSRPQPAEGRLSRRPHLGIDRCASQGRAPRQARATRARGSVAGCATRNCTGTSSASKPLGLLLAWN